jgi:hypothetical protein
MTNSITTLPLVYKGAAITDKGELLSLTDMWRAAGSPDGRAPNDWRVLVSTTEFANHVAEILNAGNSGNELFKVTRGGKASGTFAHWQIGLAYAKYLSPEFHMWCNQVVRERMEGHKAVATLSPDVMELIRRDDGISRMLAHKVTGIEATVQTLAAAVAAIVSIVQPPSVGVYVTGKTAGEIWRIAGFPRIRITSWFSNRLCEMNCHIDGNRRNPVGLDRAKLFDPDKAENWLKNGGRALVEEYVKERQGQKKLRLVSAN